MKKFISLKLNKGGKTSVLSIDKGENYKGVGSITNGHAITVRVPINRRLRDDFAKIKLHMLAISGYFSDEVMSSIDFDSAILKNLASPSNLHARALLDDTSVDYVYWSKGVVVLGGSILIHGGTKKLDIKIPKTSVADDYVMWSHLEDLCEELGSAAMDWYDNREEIDRHQMALTFIEMDQHVDSKTAAELFEAMPEEEKDAVVNKQVIKFLEESDIMEGKENEEKEEEKKDREFDKEDRSVVSSGSEEDFSGDNFGSGDEDVFGKSESSSGIGGNDSFVDNGSADKNGGDIIVDSKEEVKKPLGSKSSAAVRTKAKSKKAPRAVKVESDPFADEAVDQVIPAHPVV